MAASTKNWINNSPPPCSAEDLNGFEKENNNLISSTGIALNTADNLQTSKAVSAYAANGDFYTDTGVANAYVCTVQNNGGGPSYVAPPSYFTGMRVRFFAGNANTTASTVDVAGLGVKNIVDRNGAALNGGEIQSGRQVEIVYDSTKFILIDGGSDNTAVPTSTSLVFRGFTLPDGFLWEDGSAISRTTYAFLLGKIIFSQNGSVNNGSPIVTLLTDTSDMYVGEAVEGVGIPSGSTILSIDSGTQITLNNNASTTGTVSLTFFPYGNGDGSSTFNVPDQRGRMYLGQGQGTGLTFRMTGLQGGAQTVIQTVNTMAAHVHGWGQAVSVAAGGGQTPNNSASNNNASTTSTGLGQPLAIMNPFLVSRTIIKT